MSTYSVIPTPEERAQHQRAGEMTLSEQTARRLLLAGITNDDPALAAIHAWNAHAAEVCPCPIVHFPLLHPDLDPPSVGQ